MYSAYSRISAAATGTLPLTTLAARAVGVVLAAHDLDPALPGNDVLMAQAEAPARPASLFGTTTRTGTGRAAAAARAGSPRPARATAPAATGSAPAAALVVPAPVAAPTPRASA